MVCAVAVTGGNGATGSAGDDAATVVEGSGAAVVVCAGREIGVNGACGAGRFDSADMVTTETMIPATTARPSAAPPMSASVVANGRRVGRTAAISSVSSSPAGGTGVLV